MHNAAYAALAINRAYLAFQVSRENLAAALRAISALNIAGVNLSNDVGNSLCTEILHYRNRLGRHFKGRWFVLTASPFC